MQCTSRKDGRTPCTRMLLKNSQFHPYSGFRCCI